MISSHTGFQPLKTVWLGDVYPPHFYDHLSSELQDCLGKLTEITKNDLEQIKKKLVELGVEVQQPKFQNVDPYIFNGKLSKPPICPRDWAMVLGDTLYVTPQFESGVQPWQWAIDQYSKNNQKVCIANRFCSRPDPWVEVTFPSVVRVGRDVFIDYPANSPFSKDLESICSELSRDYRIHVTHTGDHSDAIFCPVKPGQIFSTHYRTRYRDTFPDWEVFFLKNTAGDSSGKWLCRPEHYLPYYNDALLQYAQTWVGNARETVFEVNMLVIDDKNIICIAENDIACKKLEDLGITPHVVNFKTRGFWDGVLHCITLDIHREGQCLDYWPDRGPNGVYYHT